MWPPPARFHHGGRAGALPPSLTCVHPPPAGKPARRRPHSGSLLRSVAHPAGPVSGYPRAAVPGLTPAPAARQNGASTNPQGATAQGHAAWAGPRLRRPCPRRAAGPAQPVPSAPPDDRPRGDAVPAAQRVAGLRRGRARPNPSGTTAQGRAARPGPRRITGVPAPPPGRPSRTGSQRGAWTAPRKSVPAAQRMAGFARPGAARPKAAAGTPAGFSPNQQRPAGNQ